DVAGGAGTGGGRGGGGAGAGEGGRTHPGLAQRRADTGGRVHRAGGARAERGGRMRQRSSLCATAVSAVGEGHTSPTWRALHGWNSRGTEVGEGPRCRLR